MASEADPEAPAAAQEAKRSKKEKKDKKRSDADGVHKEKKDRKKEKHASEKLANALDAHLQAEVAAEAAADEDKKKRKEERARKKRGAAEDVNMDGEERKKKKRGVPEDVKIDGDEDEDEKVEGKTSPEGALVYFAYPMADEKTHKKLFRLIKRGTTARSLKTMSRLKSRCCRCQATRTSSRRQGMRKGDQEVTATTTERGDDGQRAGNPRHRG
jgi:hypothetical protein